MGIVPLGAETKYRWRLLFPHAISRNLLGACATECTLTIAVSVVNTADIAWRFDASVGATVEATDARDPTLE